MKKIFLSLFSTSLLLSSSGIVYACNTIKKDQKEVKKTDDTNSVMATNYEIYDQNFINEQIQQDSSAAQNLLLEDENNHLSSNQGLETEEELKNDSNKLNKQTVNNNEKHDLITQQTSDSDPLILLSQVTWQFLKDAQVKNLIAQIEANKIYQNLICKINSPVELIILDKNTVKNYNDYLYTKQYTVSLNYLIQNDSLYPKIKKSSFKCNVVVDQFSQKQINEQKANKYCDLIALWNQDILHLSLKKWNESLNFYIVESLIKDIKANAKTYALIDNDQVIDDLVIFVFNNNKLVLDSKDIIENQLYNVEVGVKIGQDNDQAIKWTSFILDFTKTFIQQKEQIDLNLNDDADQQNEFESDLFESNLNSNNLDELLNYTNITLEKLINLLNKKSYFNDLITDLSLIITSSLITGS